MTKQCKNCKKPLPSNTLDFCSKKCAHEYKVEMTSENPEIEEILALIGVVRETTSKKIAYEHWYKFVELGTKMNGKEWQTTRNMMRSYVNVDFRYLDDYLKCLMAWGIFSVNNGILTFHGVPKNLSNDIAEETLTK